MKTISLQIFLLIALSLPAQRKALVGGTLVDGYGGKPIQNSVVLINGETIEKVGRVGELDIPKGIQIISTEGMTVMPGLWDMHVHMMINGHADYPYWDKKYPPLFQKIIMPASAHQLLMAGVTSARDLGGPLEESIWVRDAINRGEIPGATMYVSGPFLQHRPYPGTEQFRWGVYGEKDAREKVQLLAKAGVDCIKLIDQDEMTREEVFAIVNEAHKHKLKVVGHSHRPNEIRIGLEAGVDNFEHTGLSSAPAYPDDIIKSIAERTAQMSKGPLFWTPTIEGLYNYEDVRDNPEKIDDPSWHLGLPDSVIKDIRSSLQHPGRLSYFQLTPIRKPTLETKFRQLQKAGVVLLIGTDSGIPMKFHSQSTWNELDVWVRVFGVDPIQAIKSATYWPSVFMGVDQKVGTITEGKQADIIAVKGDAIKYINLLQKVDFVMKKGKVYKG
ncbi:MAG: amidohydrolase family protein [Bacteroidetes bacterium]|nr:amidohydrolase family protein [Bacteroidota bacterium]